MTFGDAHNDGWDVSSALRLPLQYALSFFAEVGYLPYSVLCCALGFFDEAVMVMPQTCGEKEEYTGLNVYVR